MTIRRWQDGKELAVQPLMDMAGYIGHRGDYHDVFLEWVRQRGIPIRMGSEVVQYEDRDPQPTITLKSGEQLSADIIVAVDGIKSLARPLVLGMRDDPVSSGYACFRAFFRPTPEQRADPRLNKYMREDCVNFWIGADMHMVQNTLRGGEEFNWILTHKDDGDVPESWFQPGDMEEVRRLTETLDPEIRGIVQQTESCLDWKICYRKPLPTWVSPNSHRIALLGDSCHAHLPTSAQGASQAVESAGCLAVCLDSINGPEEVRIATRAYEKLRFPRTRQSQTNGEDLRNRWHSALKGVDANREIDPEEVMIKVCGFLDWGLGGLGRSGGLLGGRWGCGCCLLTCLCAEPMAVFVRCGGGCEAAVEGCKASRRRGVSRWEDRAAVLSSPFNPVSSIRARFSPLYVGFNFLPVFSSSSSSLSSPRFRFLAPAKTAGGAVGAFATIGAWFSRFRLVSREYGFASRGRLRVTLMSSWIRRFRRISAFPPEIRLRSKHNAAHW